MSRLIVPASYAQQHPIYLKPRRWTVADARLLTDIPTAFALYGAQEEAHWRSTVVERVVGKFMQDMRLRVAAGQASWPNPLSRSKRVRI